MVRGPGQQRGLDAAPGGRLRGSDDREHHGAYAGYRRRWRPHPGQPADSPAPQQDMHVIEHHHDDHDSATDHLHLLDHDHYAHPHHHHHHPHHPPHHDHPHHLHRDHRHHLHHDHLHHTTTHHHR